MNNQRFVRPFFDLSIRVAICAPLALTVVAGPSARAQGTTGSIAGTITDSSGAAIAGAEVTVTQSETGLIKNTISSSSGFYTVPQLPPGTYQVVVGKAGFGRYMQGNITLSINQVAQLNAALVIGSDQQTVTVTSASPLIQTDTSSIGLVVDSQTIKETPLNGHTSLIGLIALAPGVQAAGSQDQVPVYGVTPAIGTGGRNAYGGVGFTLHGAQTKSAFLQRGYADTPSLEAIGEFKTITNGEPAEFNQPAQVVVVTASGGNLLHGGLFEYNRSKGTSAKSYFNGALPRSPYERNEFGANVSGPLVLPHVYNGKDRTFFFFAFEGFRLNQSASLNTQQPTVAQGSGVFTSAITDPLTGLPFASNTIPSARLNPVSTALQQLLIPLPTTSGTGVNTFELVPYTSNVTRYSIRMDHKIDEHNQLRGTVLSALYGPNPQVGADSLQGGLAGIGEHVNLDIIGYTHTFNPTLLLDSYASFTHASTYRTPQNYLTNFNNIIPGLPPQLIQGAPTISITNITGISEVGSRDLEQQIQSYTTLTKIFSRHSLKTGFGFLYSNHYNIAAVAPQRGAYTFTGRFSGNAYADFLLGYPFSTQVSYPGALPYRNITDELGAFIQDDYRVSPRLTLNVGVRYDLQLFPDNVYGAQASFVPSVGKVVVFGKTYPQQTQAAFKALTVLSSDVGLGDSLTRYLGKDPNNVAPRFGFAYQVRPDTVIRGATGIFFNLLPPGFVQTPAFTTLPFTAVQTFSQPASGPPAYTMSNPFSATGAFNANPSAIQLHSPVTPYTEQYNLAVEHQLRQGLDIRIGYVGQHNVKQNNSSGGAGNTAPNINLQNPPIVGVTTQSTNKYQPFSTVSLIAAPLFSSNESSLQIGMHKQYRNGFLLNAEYQWTRVLGTENLQNASGATPQDSYGPIAGITPQVLVVSYSYELPFGHTRAFGAATSPFTDKLISGWQISGITSAQSGQPFSVTYTAPGRPVGLVSGRADRVPHVALYPKNQSRGQFFNPAAFAAPQPVTIAGVTYAQYGNSSYDLLRGPKFQEWDINLEKNLVFRERYRLQLRAESFNFINHPNLGTPNAAISNPATFGTITGTSGAPAYQARTVEFAGKFNF